MKNLGVLSYLAVIALLTSCTGTVPSGRQSPGAPVEPQNIGDTLYTKALLTPQQRADTMERMGRALKNRYAFQKIKPVDVDTHFRQCARNEIDIPSEPFGNLLFHDRALKCVAALEDSHLVLKMIFPRPKITTGFTVRKVGSRFFVESSVRSDIWDEFYKKNLGIESFSEHFKPGTEVLQIDDKNPAVALGELAPYIAGSSPGFVAEAATEALTERDFAYPNNRFMRVHLAGSSKAVSIPWWSIDFNVREDSRAYFRKVGIRSLRIVDFGLEEPVRKKTNWQGYVVKNPLPSHDHITFYDDAGRLGMRLGHINWNGFNLCYTQYLTFSTKRWRLGSANGPSFSFEEPLGNFLVSCKKRGSPLILDLRYSDGGYVPNAAKVMSLVAEENKTYGSTYTTALVTPYLAQLYGAFNVGDGTPEIDPTTLPITLFFDALVKAHREGREYTPLVPTSNITAHRIVNGFPEKVVVLVGPHCVSTCDITASLLQRSGRAILVGSQTNGGFGTMTDLFFDTESRSTWKDDVHSMFMMRVPDSVTGVLEKPLQPGQHLIDVTDPRTAIFEGSPVRAEGTGYYEPSLLDLQSGGHGWLKKIFEVLGSTPPLP